jgi:hypothetical protein
VDYSMEELGLMFGLTLEELNEMSVNETCEYLMRHDDEDENTVHCLISDGYEGFMLIADNREDTYARTNVSLSESDLEIARVLGNGNASEGLRTALRMTIKLNQIAFDELL